VPALFVVHLSVVVSCRLRIKSRMWDACIVVDGSLSFNFNDGSEVELGIHDEDALRCVQLD